MSTCRKVIRIRSRKAIHDIQGPLDQFDGSPVEGYYAPDGTYHYTGPHHVITQKSGGPDHRLNLIQLSYTNHVNAHKGRIPKYKLWNAIARREGWSSGQAVEDAVREMMRTGVPIPEDEVR